MKFKKSKLKDNTVNESEERNVTKDALSASALNFIQQMEDNDTFYI